MNLKNFLFLMGFMCANHPDGRRINKENLTACEPSTLSTVGAIPRLKERFYLVNLNIIFFLGAPEGKWS